MTEEGVYEPISPYLRTYPDGQWGVYKAPYRTRLADRLGESEYDVRVELPDGGLLQWRVVSLGYYDRATGEFAIIESARSVELQNGSDVAIYPEIFPGIDYRVVHTNTGVRQEFVRSQSRRREVPLPSAYGLAKAELAIRVQVKGDQERSALLPFQNDRVYLNFDERDGLLLAADPSGGKNASKTGDLLLETTFAIKPARSSESAPKFDLEAAGVPKNATILSARVVGAGINQEVKEQAERWLAEPESNHGLAEFQKVQVSAAQQAQMVVEWVDNTSMVYYLKDHLGSVRATVNEVGAVVSHDDYDPWGLTLAGRSMTVQGNLPNKFTGKERDTDFGLGWDYFGARFYVPEIARWTTADPLLEKYPSLSPYVYTADNPVLFIDPNGLEVIGLGRSTTITLGVVGFTTGFSRVSDSQGWRGYAFYTGGGLNIGLGASHTFDEIDMPNLDTIFDLSSAGAGVGASGGAFGFSGGYENTGSGGYDPVTPSRLRSGKTKSFGLGLGTPEGHYFATTTQVFALSSGEMEALGSHVELGFSFAVGSEGKLVLLSAESGRIINTDIRLNQHSENAWFSEAAIQEHRNTHNEEKSYYEAFSGSATERWK